MPLSFGKLKHFGGRHYTADKDYALHIHHLRSAYHLRIYKSGKQHCLIFHKGEDIAHHIATAGEKKLRCRGSPRRRALLHRVIP
jgi:hypothetical protein